MRQVIHKGQHPLRHKSQDVNYTYAGLPSLKTVKDALDTALGVSSTSWKAPVADKPSLPLAGNSINDVRAEQSGSAIYLCIATAGVVDVQWLEITSPGATFDLGTPDGAILKKTGANTMGEVTAIPESLIVANHALSSFTNDAGIQEKGVTLNAFNLNWAFNRNSDDPTSQNITPISGASWTNPIAVALRTILVTGAALTAQQIYTFAGVGDDTTVLSGSTTVYFRSKRYWGPSGTVLNASSTGAQVRAALSGSEFGTSKAVSKTFDASAGNQYLYFAYPKSWGAPSGTLFGGFEFSDYTLYTITNFENASGHTEDYYLLKTNGQYNGSSLNWEIY